MKNLICVYIRITFSDYFFSQACLSGLELDVSSILDLAHKAHVLGFNNEAVYIFCLTRISLIYCILYFVVPLSRLSDVRF